jgi:hypothetical protein
MALRAELDDGGALPEDGSPQASQELYCTPLPLAEDEEAQLAALRAEIAALRLGASQPQEAGESQGDPPPQPSATQPQCGVYVLELAGGKFYVGSERDMGRRIEKHKAKMCALHCVEWADLLDPHLRCHSAAARSGRSGTRMSPPSACARCPRATCPRRSSVRRSLFGVDSLRSAELRAQTCSCARRTSAA